MSGRNNCWGRVRTSALAYLASTAVLVAVSAPGAAADLAYATKAPALAPVWTWTGLYLGADIGWARGRDSTAEYFTGTNTLTGLKWDYQPTGVLGGLYAGANYQFESAVLGIEGDVEATGLHGGFNDPALGGAGDTKVRWQGSLRGRLGLAADKVLFYGTGGLAFADISHTYQNLGTATTETSAAMRLGWTAGAGVEVVATPNWLLRVEYRYSDYGKYRYDALVTFPGLTGEQQPVFNAVRVGAAYRF
jgi:outer membrane immunogenic protein